MPHSRHIAVIGLGYVGLPVAVAFGQNQAVIGFDTSKTRINGLQKGEDSCGEVSAAHLGQSQLTFTSTPEDLRSADFYIVAVPTPVDEANEPDLSMLEAASRTLGGVLKAGDIVVFESTVYPGATEEVCLPILEAASGLQGGKDFYVGYSPERINPADPKRGFCDITKVVAAQTPESLKIVADVYGSVVTAGIHEASSIKVAEAAKVIENTQRDLNIALMNELAIIFHRLGIDTGEVLAAAGTKWNFLPFVPGLVGGHCIGVDPYYLTHKAKILGHHPEVILAGRHINDKMGKWIAKEIVKTMIKQGRAIAQSTIGVLGLTFKENCPDLRNSKVVTLIEELQDYGASPLIHDPLATAQDAKAEYDLSLTAWDNIPKLDAMVIAVAHDEYRNLPLSTLTDKLNPGACLFDIKGVLQAEILSEQGFHVWRL